MDLQYHKINVGQLKQVQKNSMVLKMPKTKNSLLTDNVKFPDLTRRILQYFLTTCFLYVPVYHKISTEGTKVLINSSKHTQKI